MDSQCRCSQCWSLNEVMLELTGKDYGLLAAPGHTPLKLVENPCNGDYCCGCEGCVAQRTMKRSKPVGLPWENQAA